MSKIAIITSENLASRLITEKLIDSLGEAIGCIFIISNVPTSNQREVKRFFRLLKKVSWHFLLYKFIEINVHNLLARLRGKTIAQTAARKGIRFKRYKSPGDADLVSELRKIQPTLLLSSGPVILTPALLDIPEVATLNCHGGRLPEYQGVANYLWMKLDDVPKAYTTIQIMEPVIDAGPVIAENSILIERDWSVHRLNYEVSKAGGRLYAEVTKRVLRSGLPKEVARPHAKASYRGLPTSKDFVQLKKVGKRLLTLKDMMRYL